MSERKKYITILFFVGVLYLSILSLKIFPIKYAGADDAHYLSLARNIVTGRGYVYDAISYYFDPMPITHYDSLYMPLYPFLISILFKVFWIDPFFGKFISVFFGVVMIPLVTFLIGSEFHSKKKLSFIASLIVMFNPVSIIQNIHSYSDSTFSFFILCTGFFIIKSLKLNNKKITVRNNLFIVLAAVFLGIAFYTKATALIFLISIMAFLLLSNRFKLILPFLLVFLLVICPWLIRNFVLFGDPLYHSARYMAYAFGTQERFAVFWDQSKPSAFWLIGKIGVIGLVKRFVFEALGIAKGMFPLSLLGFFWMLIKRKNVSIQFVFMFTIVPLLFFSTYFVYKFRYLLAILALLDTYAIFFLYYVLKKIKVPFFYIVSTLIILIFVLLSISQLFFLCINYSSMSVDVGTCWPFSNSERINDRFNYLSWIKNNTLSNSVIASFLPKDIVFFSERKALTAPDEDLNRTLMLYKFFNVTYFEHDLNKDLNENIIYQTGYYRSITNFYRIQTMRKLISLNVTEIAFSNNNYGLYKIDWTKINVNPTSLENSFNLYKIGKELTY